MKDQLPVVDSATGPATTLSRDHADEAVRLAALEEYRLIPLGELSEASISDQVVAGLEGLAQVATGLTGAQAAVFNIIGDTQQHQIAAWNVEPEICSREDSMCAVVFKDGETVVVPDASLDPRFEANPFVTGRIGSVRFYASAPLLSPGGHPLGTLCVFDTVVRQLSAEQGKALRLLATQAVEVLELSRRTRLLDQAVARLTAANELLTGFAGRVSHDLKAPLGVILGFTETLADEPAIAQDASASGRLERILGACRRMSRMINDLLEYAAAGGEVQIEEVDVVELVAEVRQDLERQIQDAGAKVEVSPGTVPGDHTQLRMFLQNLIANAVKYRRPDVPCRVEVDARRTASEWSLRVADNGLGIPADQREKVLQPLVRLERDRGGAAEGAGIGLATCERIAFSHGGRLEITDTPGGGTTITLRASKR